MEDISKLSDIRAEPKMAKKNCKSSAGKFRALEWSEASIVVVRDEGRSNRYVQGGNHQKAKSMAALKL
jgi:hypothetical protein